MKLIASVILSVHLLTVSAQGTQFLKVPKVDEINGDFVRNKINSRIGMDFSKIAHPIPIPVGLAPASGSGTSGDTDTKDSGSTSSGGTNDETVQALETKGGTSDPPKNDIMDL